MTTPEQPRPRVRVTSPRTAGRPLLRRTVEQEIDEETAIGEVYMRSLIRSQLRLALAVTAVLLITIGALPLVLVVFDALDDLRILSVPLPWWILGFVVYPFLFVCGLVYVRQSERIERDFSDLVERP